MRGGRRRGEEGEREGGVGEEGEREGEEEKRERGREKRRRGREGGRRKRREREAIPGTNGYTFFLSLSIHYNTTLINKVNNNFLDSSYIRL